MPANVRRERRERGGASTVGAGNGEAVGGVVVGLGRAARAAGGADLLAGVGAPLRCLSAAGALNEAVPPLIRRGEPNPGPGG